MNGIVLLVVVTIALAVEIALVAWWLAIEHRTRTILVDTTIMNRETAALLSRIEAHRHASTSPSTRATRSPSSARS